MKKVLLLLLSISIMFAVDKEDTQLFTSATINMDLKSAKSEIVYFGKLEDYIKNYKSVLENNVKKYSTDIAITSASYSASTGLRASSMSSIDMKNGLIGLVAGTAAMAVADYINELSKDEEYMFVSYVVNEKGEQGLLITLLVTADDLKFKEAKAIVENAQESFIKGNS